LRKISEDGHKLEVKKHATKDWTRCFNFRKCQYMHNPKRSTKSYSEVGENLFRSGLTPSKLPNASTKAWFDEV